MSFLWIFLSMQLQHFWLNSLNIQITRFKNKTCVCLSSITPILIRCSTIQKRILGINISQSHTVLCTYISCRSTFSVGVQPWKCIWSILQLKMTKHQLLCLEAIFKSDQTQCYQINFFNMDEMHQWKSFTSDRKYEKIYINLSSWKGPVVILLNSKLPTENPCQTLIVCI